MAEPDLYRRERRPGRRALERRRRAEWTAAESRAKTALVVTHADCLDGVGSAVVALRALGADRVGVVYTAPDGVPAVLEHFAGVPGRGRRLLVTDLSLQRADYDRIATQCARLKAAGWGVEWRDHHHKQWEGLDLRRLRREVALLEVNDDATECGCSLLQRQLAPRDAWLRRLAACVRDRDLWRNRDPDSETLEFALTELGTAAFVDQLLRSSEGDPIVTADIAEAARREREGQARITSRLLSKARFFGEPPRRVGIVYGWLPKNTGLHELLTQHGLAVGVNLRPNGRMSLRSVPKAPVCHLVAQEFKGGGHPNASGGDLGLRGLRFWWYTLTHGRGSATERVAESCIRHLKPPAAAGRKPGKAKAGKGSKPRRGKA